MINNFTIVFDGVNSIGNNISNVVYIWTRNNIPCYVGITDRDIFLRIREHLKYDKGGFFQRKLRKYKNEFKCYIIEQNKDYNKLKELERMYIEKYNTYAHSNQEFGYNLTLGGEGIVGYKHNDSNKEKIRVAKLGIKQSEKHIVARMKKMYGRKVKKETCKAISLAMTGRKLSEQHKQSLCENHADVSGKNNPFCGKKHSKETKIAMSNSRKLNHLLKWLEKEVPWFCKTTQQSNMG